MENKPKPPIVFDFKKEAEKKRKKELYKYAKKAVAHLYTRENPKEEER